MSLYFKPGIDPQELPQFIEVRVETINSIADVDEHGIAEVDVTISEETVESVNASPQQIEDAGWISAPDKPEGTDFLEYKWNGNDWEEAETEAAKIRTEMWKAIRSARDEFLKKSDILAQTYIDNNQDIPQDLIDYRQSLRDLPQVHENGSIDDWEDISVPVFIGLDPSSISMGDYNEG